MIKILKGSSLGLCNGKPWAKAVRETCLTCECYETCLYESLWGVRWGTRQLIGAGCGEGASVPAAKALGGVSVTSRVALGWSKRKVSLAGYDIADLLSQYLTLILFFCK